MVLVEKIDLEIEERQTEGESIEYQEKSNNKVVKLSLHSVTREMISITTKLE